MIDLTQARERALDAEDEAERFLDPARKREVLQRAAAWCEQHEVWRDAVDYALVAGDMESASRILDRTARMFVRDRGDIELYIRWVNTLEAAEREADCV